MTTAFRVVVCGSRSWNDRPGIECFLRWLERYAGADRRIRLAHGACRGADSLAGDVAAGLGWEVVSYLADWDMLGRAAGPVRNQRMLDVERPDAVVAFHEDLSKSKGTMDLVRRARGARITVFIVSSGGGGPGDGAL